MNAPLHRQVIADRFIDAKIEALIRERGVVLRPPRHIALGVNPGDTVLLTDEPGCIIPAGWHRVSHVNPDGTFRVGGNTAVMPERVAEIVRGDVSKREVVYLVAGLAVAFVVGVLLWVLS